MCKVKVKVKLLLCLTKHHAMKTYWGSGDIAPRILDLGLHGRERSASRLGRFAPRGRAPGTHWIGGYESERKISEFADVIRVTYTHSSIKLVLI